MRIVNKEEMRQLPRGTVFADYHPHIGISSSLLEVKDDYEFGATMLVPDEFGEPFDYDWSINEYKEDAHFLIFEQKEVLWMIKLLMRGIGTEVDA